MNRSSRYFNLREREKVQRKVKDISKDKKKRNKLYALDSCFGGVAIYDLQRIRDCTYYGVAKINERIKYLRPDCEHVSFNACASGRYKVGFNTTELSYSAEVMDYNCEGCSPALLNPRMQVWHGMQVSQRTKE